MPDAQTQPAAYSAELSVRFEVSARQARDGLGAGIPRRRRRPRDRRARAGRSAGRGRARSGMRAARRRPREPRAGHARQLGRSRGAGRRRRRPGRGRSAADRDPHLPARLPGRRRRRRRRRGAKRRRSRSPALPEHVSLFSADSELPVAELAVPALPKLLAINGSAPAAGLRVDASGGLTLSLGAAGGRARRAAAVRRHRRRQLRGPDQRVDRGRWSPSRDRCSPTCARAMRAARPAAQAFRCPSSSRAGSAAREPLVTSGARVSVEVRSTLAVELRP